MVSVNIVVYNGARFIADAIQSIIDQTYTDFELIIVDNGSRPETQKWVKKIADQSIIFKENQGFAKGFNEGVKLAQGKYLMLANLISKQESTAFAFYGYQTTPLGQT